MPATKTIRLIVKRFLTEDWTALKKRLQDTSLELMVAANKAMSALYVGSIPEGTHPQTHVYRSIPNVNVGGGVRAATASKVFDRFKNDKKAMISGRQSLATFKKFPLPVRQQEIRIVDSETISLGVWAKGTGNTRLFIRVQPRGRGHEATWKRICGGDYKYKSAELTHDDYGRWYLNLVYHTQSCEEIAAPAGVNTLGVDLGMIDMAAVSVVDSDGKLLARERFSPPCNFWRLFREQLQVKREIGKANRQEYGLREGRGRAGKLKPLSKRGFRYRRRVKDAVRSTAAAVVRYALQNNCGTVVLENLSWSTKKLHSDAANQDTKTKGAWLRNRFLRWNQGLLRATITQKAKEYGLTVVEVNPAYTSQTCSSCGQHGNRDGKKFSCPHCGLKLDADINAATNVALEHLKPGRCRGAGSRKPRRRDRREACERRSDSPNASADRTLAKDHAYGVSLPPVGRQEEHSEDRHSQNSYTEGSKESRAAAT